MTYVPSLKLTASLHLKMDGWKTILSFWDALFSGAMLVSGSVIVWFRSFLLLRVMAILFYMSYVFISHMTNFRAVDG